MNRLTIIKDDTFIGYNDRIAPEYLSKGYLADALNCFIRTGEIVKRNGYTIIADDLGSVFCQGLKGVEFANGTKELLAVFNGGIYKWTGSGNWSSLGGTLSTSAQVDIVVANNNVYFFDGTNTVPKYNGTAVSTVAAIPIGLYARWFHNQLHVAGISGTPNTLKSSDIGDPEIFTGGNSSTIAVNANDGDMITGLHEFKDELVVFKRKRIWSMTGFGTTALTLTDLNERITDFGTLSHRSIVNVGNDLLYIGFLGDKPTIRSLQRTRFGTLIDGGVISLDIETTMNGLNKAQLTKVAGVFDGRFAWFACPNGASTTNNLALTYDTIGTPTTSGTRRGWTRHVGINASVFESFAISATPQLYFGEAGSDSKVYVFDTSTSDNGTAINFSITTRRYGADAAAYRKKHKWLYIFAKETGNYNVTIDKASDGFTFDNLGTLNLAGSGSIFDSIVLDTSRLGTTDVHPKRFTIAKDKSRYIQFKMYETSATSAVTIRNWELYRQDKKAPIHA